MDVLAAAEGLDHRLLAGDVGQYAELDLAVVRGDQERPGGGAERPTDLHPELRADGNVLQIRIHRRQPAGGGDRLLEAGVDAAVPADDLRQGVDVGRLQLRELAVAQQVLR